MNLLESSTINVKKMNFHLKYLVAVFFAQVSSGETGI